MLRLSAHVLERLVAPVERALLKVHGGMDPRDIDQVRVWGFRVYCLARFGGLGCIVLQGLGV
jgi:hypothetical protein